MITLEKEAYRAYEELIQMAERSREKIAQFLAMGIPPDLEDSQGETPLFIAARYGDDALIKLLLEHEAEPNYKNKYGDTALRVAVEYNHPAVVAALLEGGADVNTQDVHLRGKPTMLMLAATNGHAEIVELLLKKGAEPNI